MSCCKASSCGVYPIVAAGIAIAIAGAITMLVVGILGYNSVISISPVGCRALTGIGGSAIAGMILGALALCCKKAGK
ncbi:MAG TPA: hypothetical protein VIH61_07705 [Waddliaceae bacterium]